MLYIKEPVSMTELVNFLNSSYSKDAIGEIYEYIHQRKLDIDLRDIPLYFEVKHTSDKADDIVATLSDGTFLIVLEHYLDKGTLHIKREPSIEEFKKAFEGKNSSNFTSEGLACLHKYLTFQASEVIDEDSEFKPDEILHYFDEVSIDKITDKHTILSHASNGNVIVDLFSSENRN